MNPRRPDNAATDSEDLRQGRSAFDAHAWAQAYAHLSAADAAAPLGVDDLERLATTATLLGKDEASADLWARAQHDFVLANNAPRAARCVFWIALDLLNTGEHAHASGWLARGQRVLDETHADCAERGLLLLLSARLTAIRGDLPAASQMVANALAHSRRFDDPDLEVFARLSHAQVRARAGDTAFAAALYDEIMVAVTMGEVSPIAVGTIYCAVIDGCQSMSDVDRAREWTDALSRWCDAQPDLVLFRGQCLVHRAEILRLSGELPQAEKEVTEVCVAADMNNPRLRPYVGAALYELGEIHRVRGDFAQAEDAYRRSAQCGRSPEPGLALLRLSQNRSDVAAASIRRVLGEKLNRATRARALAACVDIMIAVRDRTAARAAASELRAVADASDVRFLRALAAHASGAVLLAEGDARAALADLRSAWMVWQEIEAPYESARVRVLLALACRALGDHDAADLELESAARVFQRIGAHPDVAHVDELRHAATPLTASKLTIRELEVIRLVAGGKTNRAIAQQLAISERTVDRHVANILRKLDLSTRSAATAYAYDHGLL